MVAALVGWGHIITLGNVGVGLMYYTTVNWTHKYPPLWAVVKTNHGVLSTAQMPP